MNEVFLRGLTIDGIRPVTEMEGKSLIGEFAALSRGLLFEVDRSITPSGLANVFRELDRRYRQVHEALFRVFADNHDDVAMSGYREAFNIRRDGFYDSVRQQAYPEGVDRFLRTVHHFLQDEGWVMDKDHKERRERHGIFRAPSYSAVIMHAENPGLVLAFCPSMQRRCGIIEAFGIVADKKTVEGATFSARRERAQVVFNEIVAVNR